MKISILTPSYNQAGFIEETILSVLNQNYDNFEHIIIDGGSTDNTVSVIKKYPHLKWVSEKDDGQADALNKGLKMATGDVIGWINSDDYYQPEIFNGVASLFLDESTKWVIGNITYYYTGLDLMKPDVSPDISYEALLKSPDIVRQPGVFFRRDTLDEVGGWNKKYYMVMDYDLWVRIAKKYTPKMINENYSFFRWHEEQKSTARNALQQLKEMKIILKENNVSAYVIWTFSLKKYFYLFKAVIKNLLIKIGLIDAKFSGAPLSISRSK